MKLINKSRGTGKTTQLIYASAITGFRIIAPNHAMAKHIEEMAKDMGFKISKPMSDVEYRNRKELWNDHTPILIDELQNEILNEALELYFGTPVIAATMTVPIDDDCFPPTPKPLVFDHTTKKVRLAGKDELEAEPRKTNRDVFNEHFGHLMFRINHSVNHLEDKIMIQTENGEDIRFVDWLSREYLDPREEERNE